jgi:hypothetical protein
MTFTEAFYLFLQALLFFWFFKLYDVTKNDESVKLNVITIKKIFNILILISFIIALIVIFKSINNTSTKLGWINGTIIIGEIFGGMIIPLSLFLLKLLLKYLLKHRNSKNAYVNFSENQPKKNTKLPYKLWIMLGLFTFLIATCKSVAIVAVPVLMLFFLFEKQWQNACFALGAYLIFKIPYELIVKLIWGAQNQFSGQSKILLQKDPYDKSLGNDDLSGFIGRFFDNCSLYLGKRFYELLGLREEHLKSIESQLEADKLNREHNYLAFFVVVVLLMALYKIIKEKNKPLLFFSLFTGAELLLSFLILQARWDQPRIVLICMPVMLILMFYLLFDFVKKSGMGQGIYLVLVGMICLSVLISSFKRGTVNLPIVKKNLAGNVYFGYTPDWQNFLRCSEWCADSLPKNTLVASRKAPMSFVYGKGKKFFPIYSVIKKDSLTQQSHPDSALAFFSEKGVTHIMVGSLRINPKENSVQVINTVHNIIQPIMDKYHNRLKLIHTEGVSEQSYIFEITK